MSRPQCSVEGCEKRHNSHGLCGMHSKRLERHGTLDPSVLAPRALSGIDRFLAYVNKTETCWLWLGTKCSKGYGRVKVDGASKSAHRVAYECFWDDIPDGLELDHLCNVRNCVNPEHLEPVTHQENVARARIRQTHCVGCSTSLIGADA